MRLSHLNESPDDLNPPKTICIKGAGRAHIDMKVGKVEKVGRYVFVMAQYHDSIYTGCANFAVLAFPLEEGIGGRVMSQWDRALFIGSDLFKTYERACATMDKWIKTSKWVDDEGDPSNEVPVQINPKW